MIEKEKFDKVKYDMDFRKKKYKNYIFILNKTKENDIALINKLDSLPKGEKSILIKRLLRKEFGLK